VAYGLGFRIGMFMMRNFKKSALLALVTVSALAAVPTASNAAVLLLQNTGWQYGQDSAKNTPQDNAPIYFKITESQGGVFSFTDGFLAGDTFKITQYGNTTATPPKTGTYLSTFATYYLTSDGTPSGTPFVNNFGPAASYFASDWTSNKFSHFQALLDAGSYSIVVTNTANVGYPSGFGFRLDVVPEPATWMMMLFGFGIAGFALRRRNSQVASFA